MPRLKSSGVGSIPLQMVTQATLPWVHGFVSPLLDLQRVFALYSLRILSLPYIKRSLCNIYAVDTPRFDDVQSLSTFNPKFGVGISHPVFCLV